jgi:penicillin-binding protein 2
MGNKTFHCWHKNGHGSISLHRAIVESCDVYFYNVGKLLGVDKIAKYAKLFGLGEASGIDLPNEKTALYRQNNGNWRERRSLGSLVKPYP